MAVASLTLAAPAQRATPLYLLFLGLLTSVEFLQNGMVNFAAPYLGQAIGAAPEHYSLSATAYSAAAIVALFKHRWIVERWGYLRFILASLAAYTLGTVLCASAGDVPVFIAGRAIQGAAGATFFCAGRILSNQVAGPQRLHAMVAFVIGLLTASSIAPGLAAWLLHVSSWTMLFWSMLPLLGAVALLSPRFLPRETVAAEQRSPAHWNGLTWLALGVIGLQYTGQRLPYALFSHPVALILAICGGAALVGWFVHRQWRHAAPLIDYRALFHLRYLIGTAFYFFCYFVANANGYFIPLFLRQALGMDLLQTGALMTVAAVSSLVGALVHFKLALVRPGFKVYMLVALALLLAFGILMGGVGPATSRGTVAALLVLNGLFASFFLGPVAQGTFAQINPDEDARAFSHAYQTKNIIRELASSSGIAWSVLALQAGQWHHGGSAEVLTAQSHVLSDAARHVLLLAGQDYFHLLAGIALIAALLVLGQRVFR